MQSKYSDEGIENILLTLDNISETIDRLLQWNCNVSCVDDYTGSQSGMQLLAADCTLITAIGEGINRCNRILPDFLEDNFPEIPWRAIIGMRNHIAHGYFEIDADIIFDVIKNDIPQLDSVIKRAIKTLNNESKYE